MKKNLLICGLMMVALMGLQGCASADKQAEVKDISPFTPLDTKFSYVTPQELSGRESVVVALINVDFSQTQLLFDCSVAEFEPHKTRGDVYLKIKKSSNPLISLAELKAEIEKNLIDVPLGIIVLIDGEPVGVAGKSPTPEQNGFFREFADMMRTAGIQYAYIVPEKVTISR